MMKKILLADDSITIRKVVGIIFAAEDFQLLTTADGDSAYDMAVAEKPDLVIADMSMPGKSGFDLCRAIKSHKDLAATSVLLLTGAFEPFDEADAAAAAADGWLVKPFESQVLLDKVTQLLASSPRRLSAADEAESFVVPEEEDFFTGDEPATDEREASGAESSMTDDEEIWGEVSFADEDLTPQDLLAATDEDEPEQEPFADFDLTDDGGTVSEESEGPAAGHDQVLTADTVDTEADADELIELMEDDLAAEEDLVEDEETFIGHEGDRADRFTADSAEEDEDVLELTESDIVDGEVEDDSEPLPYSAREAADSQLSFASDSESEASADFVFEGADAQEDESGPGFTFAADEAVDTSGTAVDDETDFTFGVEAGDEAAGPFDKEQGAEATPVFGAEQEPEPEVSGDVAGAPEGPTEAPERGAEQESFVPAESAATEDETTPAATASFVEDEAKGTTRQLEDQLAALPEDELRRIVAEAAGPLIEKLAREMVEQVVWEVVPDLAETLISAEIEKIKQDNG